MRILARARDLSPAGRRKIVLTQAGEAALQWDDGLTTLEGQGLLPLDEAHASVDDLFEAAALAEAQGDLDEAARLYDMCARADRRDAIAPYNYANIRLVQGRSAEAMLAYQQALARDPKLIEARYNLAQALEAAGKAGRGCRPSWPTCWPPIPTYRRRRLQPRPAAMQAGDMAEAKAPLRTLPDPRPARRTGPPPPARPSPSAPWACRPRLAKPGRRR